MVRVIPFKAYRYNGEKVGDMGKVVAPPYDVIKGKKVDEIQSLSPYNIAWITKNKPREGDTADSNQYTRARDHLREWIDKGILVRDPEDCYYVYGQNFEIDGEPLFRFGFIGLIELEEFAKEAPPEGGFAGVLQHEETLPKDIQDRLNLSRNTLSYFGQIFVIYPDSEGDVDSVLESYMETEPVMDVNDMDGVRHRLWKVAKTRDIETISRAMESKFVIIADGHHRYKTALALRKEHPELETAGYRMLTFVNMSNPGLVILPTHRLVQNLESFDKEKLLSDLRSNFIVRSYDGKDPMFREMDRLFKEGKHAFGLYMNDGKFYSMELKDLCPMDGLRPDASADLRKLDVAILHSMILDRVLGID
ncbi:MAG: DUF1015 family protein, partial [Thermoplasmatota archaeon]